MDKRWICSLESGVASLIYPGPLSVGSEHDLIEWLEFTIRVLKKRRKQRRDMVIGAIDPIRD